jgi:hypothetical protein
MTDADAIYNSTVRQTWDALHGAYQNQFYHQKMAEIWLASITNYRILGITLIILGLAPILYTFRRTSPKKTERKRVPSDLKLSLPSNPKIRPIAVLVFRAWFEVRFRLAKIRPIWRNVFALALSIVGGIIFVKQSDGMYTEHHILYIQWVGLTTEIQSLRNKLLDLPSDKQVAPDMIADLQSFQRRMKDLYKSETDVVDKSQQIVAWEDANQQLYGDHVRTQEQADRAYAEQELQGRIPVRPKPTLPKAPAPKQSTG